MRGEMMNYFINFIACVFCIIAAIWEGYYGNVGFCLIEIGCALINLPLSIVWLKEFFEDNFR
jgi:hypothetical protein